MKLMMVVAALLVWLPAVEAAAGLDPNPDSVGIYFDPAGNANTATVPPFVPFHAYLIVSNPTSPLDAFECVVTRVGAPSFELSADLGEDAVDSDATADGYRVARATPFPVLSGVAVLVDWVWMLQTPYLLVYVGPGSDPLLPGGLPVLGNAGAYRLAPVSSGSPDLAVACINDWRCATDDAPSSFGAVKSLYR